MWGIYHRVLALAWGCGCWAASSVRKRPRQMAEAVAAEGPCGLSDGRGGGGGGSLQAVARAQEPGAVGSYVTEARGRPHSVPGLRLGPCKMYALWNCAWHTPLSLGSGKPGRREACVSR